MHDAKATTFRFISADAKLPRVKVKMKSSSAGMKIKN